MPSRGLVVTWTHAPPGAVNDAIKPGTRVSRGDLRGVADVGNTVILDHDGRVFEHRIAGING